MSPAAYVLTFDHVPWNETGAPCGLGDSTAKLRLNLASAFNPAHLIQFDYGYGQIGGVRGGTGSVSNPTLIFDNDPNITNALDPNAPGKPVELTIGMLAATLAPLTGGAGRPPWAR